ncbi:DUF4025 domain-containing protein [Paraliobacillus sediminis]|nr:DUF4025 domain-containing protein [Paraliobacillus sediminis]
MKKDMQQLNESNAANEEQEGLNETVEQLRDQFMAGTIDQINEK